MWGKKLLSKSLERIKSPAKPPRTLGSVLCPGHGEGFRLMADDASDTSDLEPRSAAEALAASEKALGGEAGEESEVLGRTESEGMGRSFFRSEGERGSQGDLAGADSAFGQLANADAADGGGQWTGLRKRSARGGAAVGGPDVGYSTPERDADGGAGAGNGEAVNGEGSGSGGGAHGAGGAAKGVGKARGKRWISNPVHRELRESPLSSNAIFKQSHAGLVNLCIVVLVAVNGRLIIENLLKYGILIRANFWFAVDSWRDWPLFVCGLSLAIFPMLALLIEWLKIHTKVPNQAIVALHALNIAVEFLYPSFLICTLPVQPMGGFVLIFITVVMMMKLISYAHTNHDLRKRIASGETVEEQALGDEPSTYPENLTVANMLYFMAAPTLCYQLGYPRTPEVRKGFLIRQIVLLLSFLCLMVIIIEQYITPIIRNSKHPLKGHLVESVERVLRLSIPTLYVWLCTFFVFFHLWLNILAEVLRFGDRDFYKDWWNARTIEEYWRLWNMPVHRWIARHIYFPCLNAGFNKAFAMFVVFFLSAVFHEVLIGIPCRMFRLWAFLGMMFQVPLVIITNVLYKKYQNPIVGNMVFWFIFCIVGQPMCVLLYYHDVQLLMASK